MIPPAAAPNTPPITAPSGALLLAFWHPTLNKPIETHNKTKNILFILSSFMNFVIFVLLLVG
jgi:hypothetical protein